MRTAPINLRAMTSQRDLIDHACQLLGKTRSDFMLEVACEQAKNVILDQTFFQLDEQSHEQFLQILDKPLNAESELELQKLMAVRPVWQTL